MIARVVGVIIQIAFLLLLFLKNRNDGGKELFKKQPWRLLDIVMVVFMFNLVLVVMSTDFFRHTISRNISIPGLIILFIFLVLFKPFTDENISIIGFKWKAFAKMSFIVVIAVPTFTILCPIIIQLLILNGKTVFGVNRNILIVLTRCFSFIDYSFAIFILSPFIEEICWRGILYSPFRKKLGPIIAILVNALMFSMAHPSNLILGFIYGVVLCTIFEKTRSLEITITSHITLNIVNACIIGYVLKSGDFYEITQNLYYKIMQNY